MRRFLVKLLTTFFGTGYFPIAPGSAGSLAAAAIIWFLIPNNSIHYIIIIFILIPIVAWLCGHGKDFWGKTDARKIVIDEALGMAITYIWIPKKIPLFLIGFLLFRLYDIVKIPPASRAEKIPGGWGVLLDDVISGIYANIGLWILILLTGV